MVLVVVFVCLLLFFCFYSPFYLQKANERVFSSFIQVSLGASLFELCGPNRSSLTFK